MVGRNRSRTLQTPLCRHHFTFVNRFAQSLGFFPLDSNVLQVGDRERCPLEWTTTWEANRSRLDCHAPANADVADGREGGAELRVVQPACLDKAGDGERDGEDKEDLQDVVASRVEGAVEVVFARDLFVDAAPDEACS